MALELNQNEVREYLINLAKQRRTCGYKELADDIGGEGTYQYRQHGYEVADLGGEISKEEATAKPPRPLLSVLIVNQGTKLPGGGFFKLAQEIGLFHGDPENESHQREYTKYELARVYDYWSTKFDSSDEDEVKLHNRDFDASKTPEEKELLSSKLNVVQLPPNSKRSMATSVRCVRQWGRILSASSSLMIHPISKHTM